jgi:hypothetical protein
MDRCSDSESPFASLLFFLTLILTGTYFVVNLLIAALKLRFAKGKVEEGNGANITISMHPTSPTQKQQQSSAALSSTPVRRTETLMPDLDHTPSGGLTPVAEPPQHHHSGGLYSDSADSKAQRPFRPARSRRNSSMGLVTGALC